MSSSLNQVTSGHTKRKALVPTRKVRKILLYLPFVGGYRCPFKGSAVILGRAHMGPVKNTATGHRKSKNTGPPPVIIRGGL